MAQQAIRFARQRGEPECGPTPVADLAGGGGEKRPKPGPVTLSGDADDERRLTRRRRPPARVG